eukprot:CAMPEP_0176485734 /NCGR_PEP_ID=MMETSP0200_2-20121128/5194_1 /TAXON_ID=947934 /ORGANISM="Chaetoceros sp., Strain GSL56" /LENGTH=791 /DNA_ID=CAMNT_0017882391 /DNA_START=469 /DNA_END=2844 /DNA_ORIENTATION=-
MPLFMTPAEDSTAVPSSSSSSSSSSSLSSSSSAAIMEAKRLREKAQELMKEAELAENALESSKRKADEKRIVHLDGLYQELMNGLMDMRNNHKHDHGRDENSGGGGEKEEEDNILWESIVDDTAPVSEWNRLLGDKLREKRLSTDTMMQLVERLYERQVQAEKTIGIVFKTKNGTTTAGGGGGGGGTIVGGTQTTKNNGEDKSVGFQIGDRSNSREYLEKEFYVLQWFMDRILGAQALLDEEQLQDGMKKEGGVGGISSGSGSRGVATALEARLRELKRAQEQEVQRQMAVKLSDRSRRDGDNGIKTLVSETMGLGGGGGGGGGERNVTIKVDGKEITGSKVNITRLMEDIVQVPMWVPSSILPFLIVHRKEIDANDFKKMKTQVLSGSQFRLENWDFTRMAAVYRGFFVNNKRGSLDKTISMGNTREEMKQRRLLVQSSFEDIQKRLEDAGMSDRIQLFLMEDPEWRPGSRDPEPLPAILAVSSDVKPEQVSERGKATKFFTGLSIIGTVVATFAYSVSAFALNPSFFNSIVNNSDISKISYCFPVFMGVFGISLIHEIAHRIVAHYSNMKLGLPVPLPSLQIGTFGSITPLRSFPKSRSDLFDVAMSGPLTSAILSIALMILGISLTVQASSEVLDTLAVIPVAFMKTSFLVGTICSYMAPKVMMMPLSQLIPVHPLFIVGFSGLITSALNLLPIGRLDGGRATTAVFGRRSSYLISLSTLFFLSVAALTQTSAISIFFGLLVTLFQRNAEIPMRDELTELDDRRVGIYIFSVVLTLLTLAPFPGGPIL